MADEYGDHHRYFLQALISRHICTGSQVKQLFADAFKSVDKEPDAKLLPQFVLAINDKLKPLDLEIRKCQSETLEGKSYYALISTAPAPGGLKGACAAYPELALRYLAALIEEIVLSGVGQISTMAALNLVDAVGGGRTTKRDAEAMLAQFQADCWLELGDNQLLYLHARCIMELGPYLTERYQEHLGKCNLCSKLVVHHLKCSHCKVTYHRFCIKQYNKLHKTSKMCAHCKKPLTG